MAKKIKRKVDVLFTTRIGNTACGSRILVNPGYFYNFLQPYGLAVMYNEELYEKINKSKQIIQDEKLIEESKKLENQYILLERQAGGTGVLYGSVNTKDITNFIKENYGLSIENKKIIMNTAIKKVGKYEILVNMGDLQIKMYVIVSVSLDDCKKLLKEIEEGEVK